MQVVTDRHASADTDSYAHTSIQVQPYMGEECWMQCMWHQQLWWSRGSVLAFGTQVCGFKPGRSCRIFKGN